MKRIRRLICTLLSISMILTATAIYAFGQTIDSVNQGNVSDSSSKELKLQVMDTGNRFPGVEISSSVPKLKMNRKGAKIGRGEKLRLKAFYYPPTRKGTNFRWVSTNRKVAKVTSDGIVKGIRPGRTNIVVSQRSNPSVRAICKVTVGYSIKYHTKGGRLARRSPRVYYNERVTLKDPVKKGYEFKGWYIDRGRTRKITYIDKDADRDYTLYAKWEKE